MHLLAANRESDNIVIYDRDAKTGKLTPTGQVMTDIPTAVWREVQPVQLNADVRKWWAIGIEPVSTRWVCKSPNR